MGRTENKVSVVYNGEDYHGIQGRLSSSALKTFAKDRKKFYKRYILNEKVEEEDSEYVVMGRLVDVKLTDNENFDKCFVVASANKPSGQLLTFVQRAAKLKLEDKDAEKEIVQILNESYEFVKEGNGGKLRDKYETFVEKFNKDGVGYFQELLNSDGKTVVTIEEIERADSIVKKYNDCDTFKPVGEKRLTKFVIFFNIMGEEFKAELDEVEFDEVNKVIYPFDVKVVSFIEGFTYQNFLKFGYYLQNSVYHYALDCWKVENGYADWKVENLAFKVLDCNNYYAPLLYKTTDKHYEQGFNGFYVGRTYYKGIYQLIEEIKEAKENDVWDMSIQNFRNNGVAWIPDFLDEINE